MGLGSIGCLGSPHADSRISGASALSPAGTPLEHNSSCLCLRLPGCQLSNWSTAPHGSGQTPDPTTPFTPLLFGTPRAWRPEQGHHHLQWLIPIHSFWCSLHPFASSTFCFFFLSPFKLFGNRIPSLMKKLPCSHGETGGGTAPAAQLIYCPCGASQGSTMTLQLSTALLNDGN